MKEDSDRKSEPAKGETNHRLVSNPSLGYGAPVKISARSDGRIKSYTPICVACAGPYCINHEDYMLCFITWDYMYKRLCIYICCINCIMLIFSMVFILPYTFHFINSN